MHAEYALVPHRLLARLPDEVDFESGAFATLGAIALHGFRLGEPQLGESVAVIGLGLLGLLGGAIARAAGCRVFGVDLDPGRVELARSLGLTASGREQAEEAGSSFSTGRGFDLVLICANSASDDPVALAGTLARDRGRVVAVGAVGMALPRKIYYEKEITLRVSRSYGPGRYDPSYEEGGLDYPYGFVRWTEGRNLQAMLDLMAGGRLDVHPLISHRFEIAQAEQAYALLRDAPVSSYLGVLFSYPSGAEAAHAPVALAAAALGEHSPGGCSRRGELRHPGLVAGDATTNRLGRRGHRFGQRTERRLGGEAIWVQAYGRLGIRDPDRPRHQRRGRAHPTSFACCPGCSCPGRRERRLLREAVGVKSRGAAPRAAGTASIRPIAAGGIQPAIRPVGRGDERLPGTGRRTDHRSLPDQRRALTGLALAA